MKRRPFTILSALSLLLLVVWLFTYGWSFAIYRQAGGQFRCLALHEGRVVYATERPDREHPNIDKVASNWGVNVESGKFFNVVTAAKRREFMGFGRDSHRQSLTDAPVGGNVVLFFVWHRWWMPLWFFWLLTAAYPLWRAAKAARALWRSKLESRIGLCPSCGYDLRATPDRCPECGRAATPP